MNVTASLNRMPELFLQHFQPLNTEKNAFRINATFAAHAEPTNKDIAEMFGRQVDYNLSVVAGSIDRIGENQSHKIVSFLAQGNVVNRSLNEAEGRMTCVSANVFVDNEDNTLWRAEGEGEHRRLVQATQEDWGALLNSRLARRSGTMVTASAYTPFHHGIRPSVTDFTMFYNTERKSVDYGFALPVQGGDVVVASMKGGNLVTVKPLAIIEACNLSQQSENVVPSTIKARIRQGVNILAAGLPMSADPVLEPNTDDFTAPMASTFLTYMASLYKGTDFFTKLSQLIAHRREIANEGAPLTTMKPV